MGAMPAPKGDLETAKALEASYDDFLATGVFIPMTPVKMDWYLCLMRKTLETPPVGDTSTTFLQISTNGYLLCHGSRSVLGVA
jgi:hypothetical protein